MDIVTHTLSGVAVGTVVMSFSRRGFLEKTGIVSISALGAALPDLDAISLWSRFDNTIGKIFGLEHSGKEIYFSKFWYSHHSFLHSALAGFLIAISIWLCLYFLGSWRTKRSFSSLISSLNKYKLILIGFLSGFIVHLLGDIPTPSCVWGGINFFWPANIYIGGTGDTWWWNNYDIFIIVIMTILINFISATALRWMKIDAKKLTITVFILGLTLGFIQIKSRNFDFNYTGHTPRYNEFEIKSKELQVDILGDGLYNFMDSLDNKLPLNF